MSSHTRLYVGRLNQRTRKSDLEDLFSRFGKIVSCDLKNGLGFGFVEFEDYRDAEDAVKDLDGTDLDGSRINVQFSRSSKRGANSSGRYGPPQRSDHRCVVDYIPRDMSWQDLKDHFRKYCEVIYADVWQERGRTKGAVEFRSREDMRKAIKELDGSEIRGSKIDVFEDEDRHSRSSSSSSSSYSRRSPRSSYSRRSYSRSRSRDRRRSRKNRSRSRSRSPPSRSRSRSRSDSRKRGKAWSRSRSPKRSLSPRKKSPSRFDRSPSKSKSRSPSRSRSKSRSKSRSRSKSHSPVRDHSRGRSASRSPGPHKRSRSPSPDRADKRVKLEETESS